MLLAIDYNVVHKIYRYMMHITLNYNEDLPIEDLIGGVYANEARGQVSVDTGYRSSDNEG